MSRIKLDSKKAFTLVEIIIVVFIISLVYYFSISNLNIKSLQNRDNVSIINLKSYLLNQSFNDEITIKCIKDGALCYIIVDGEITDNKIKDLFVTRPNIYTYDKNLDSVEFQDLELEKLESFDVCFEYTIDKDLKSKDMVVEIEDKVYIFNSIHKKPIILDYLSDVSIYFEDKQQELKDAF